MVKAIQMRTVTAIAPTTVRAIQREALLRRTPLAKERAIAQSELRLSVGSRI